MNKIYVVEANFDQYESSWSTTIGVYSDKLIADLAKEKWDKFYIENKKLFDGLDPDAEDDIECDKYYHMKAMYGEILEFNSITITEFDLNKEVFTCQNSMRTDKMNEILKQWERDYKINQVLKKTT